MTASVRDIELRRKGGLESLLVRELVRARRVSSAEPRQLRAPDPATCLVTRAQLMQRVLSRTHAHAVGLLEGAVAAVQDPDVALLLTRTLELARELPELIELPDIDLVEMLGAHMSRLRAATRQRLFAIASTARVTLPGTVTKVLLLGEHGDLRQAAFDYEQANVLLRRMLQMNADFDVLCSLDSTLAL